ncbi:MAG: complex I 24 kDa subunit family protein [Dehalococcoidia bacterium]
MAYEAVETSTVEGIINRYSGDSSALIQVLLDIQRENRWLPKDTLKLVSQSLGVPLTQVYHIASFYKAFSLIPKGRNQVTVCLGTACHTRGAPRLLDRVSTSLKLNPGETSEDMRFSLDTVNCLGCCALGPVMMVGEQYYSNPSTEELENIFSACE